MEEQLAAGRSSARALVADALIASTYLAGTNAHRWVARFASVFCLRETVLSISGTWENSKRG
jgi:hypothetical protein